jgi:hypothetical protein
MEISEVRKRLLLVIDQSRRGAEARQARAETAAAAYERFLETVGVPVFQMFASALRAERHQFTVFTPQGGLRLASARAAEDYIELALDTSGDESRVIARISRGRGSRVLSHERPVREATAPEGLTQEDVLEMLLDEIGPFVER